jgi:hypothetical protein
VGSRWSLIRLAAADCRLPILSQSVHCAAVLRRRGFQHSGFYAHGQAGAIDAAN